MTTRVFVGNILLDTNRREIEHLVFRFGGVEQIVIKKGFAFVDFEFEHDAKNCVRELHGQVIFPGRKLTVEIAK